jgi:hypothetical protein
LRSLRDAGNLVADEGAEKCRQSIYSVFHSQDIWFLREDPNPHSRAAREYLDRCDALLGECTAMVDALEETLARTPKPSEIIDWNSLWW